MINVGGSKAFAGDIERVLLEHPSVAWCRVRAVKAAFVGELPEADIVLNPREMVPSERDLADFCTSRLPEYAVPRLWNFLEKIPVESSLKAKL